MLIKGSRKLKLPEGMDKECIDICNALNSLEGVETSESCCGHGKHDFHVWFLANGLENPGMLLLRRLTNRNYYGFTDWSIQLQSSDYTRYATSFLLEGPTDQKGYDQAQKIAKVLIREKNNNSGNWLTHHKRVWSRNANDRAELRRWYDQFDPIILKHFGHKGLVSFNKSKTRDDIRSAMMEKEQIEPLCKFIQMVDLIPGTEFYMQDSWGQIHWTDQSGNDHRFAFDHGGRIWHTVWLPDQKFEAIHGSDKQPVFKYFTSVKKAAAFYRKELYEK